MSAATRRRSRRTARATATSTHSTSACAPRRSAEQDGRDPRAASSAESAQNGTPTISGSAPRTGAAQRRTARTTSASSSTSNGSRDASARTRPLEVGVGRGRAVEDSPDLASTARSTVSPGIVRRSAWSDAARRVARELLAALDQRRVHAAAAEVGGASGRRAAGDRAPRCRRGRGPSSRSRRCRDRAASRARRGRSSRPRDATKPRCATRDLHVGGLGDDRGVRAHRGGDRLRADARELLVGDGGEDHVAAQARAARPRPSRACTPPGSPSCRCAPRPYSRPPSSARHERVASSRRHRPCPCARSASASARRPSPARCATTLGRPRPARPASSRAPRARTTRRRSARARSRRSRRRRARG